MAISATVNLDQFTARIERVSARIRTDVAHVIMAYATKLVQTLALDTPILSGQAKANWFANINFYPNEPVFFPKGPDGKPIINHGIWPAQMAENTRLITEFKIGDTIYISNHLPYIQRLNDGWSAQAPAQFVEFARAQARLDLRGAWLVTSIQTG